MNDGFYGTYLFQQFLKSVLLNFGFQIVQKIKIYFLKKV
jgi:hypothetical protein